MASHQDNEHQVLLGLLRWLIRNELYKIKTNQEKGNMTIMLIKKRLTRNSISSYGSQKKLQSSQAELKHPKYIMLD